MKERKQGTKEERKRKNNKKQKTETENKNKTKKTMTVSKIYYNLHTHINIVMENLIDI